MKNTISSGNVNSSSTGELSDFEQQQIKNDSSFRLLVKSHILGNALIDRRLDRSHRYIVYAIARGMRLDGGGLSTIDRDEVCEHLQISRASLRVKLSQLKNFGYLHREEVATGMSSDTFVFGDEAVDHKRIMSEYLQLVGEITAYCDTKRSSEPLTPALQTVNAHVNGCEKPSETVNAHRNAVNAHVNGEAKSSTKPLTPTVTVDDDPPTDSEATLYIEESIPKGIDAARRIDDDDFSDDLLEDECLPPKVVVARAKSYISYKEPNWKKSKKIAINFLLGLAGKGADPAELFDFAEHVIESFYAGAYPEKLKSGAKRTIENHLVGSFKIYNSQQEFTLFEMWRRGKLKPSAGKRDSAYDREMRGILGEMWK